MTTKFKHRGVNSESRIPHNRSCDTRREALKRHKGDRLKFEGVLCDILQPNIRNGFTYGLVFLSLYVDSHNIEIDHAVIKLDKSHFNSYDLQVFNRYEFTVMIDSYYKATDILGISAQREYFMLSDINKIQKVKTSNLGQPTLSVTNRLTNVMASKTITPEHTEEELMDIVMDLEDDGSVEEFINDYTKNLQHKKMDSHQIIKNLYKEKRSKYGTAKC